MTAARIRAAIVKIVDHGDSTTILGPSGALRFDDASAALVRACLEIHARPVTRDALFAELAERSGGEVPAAPVDALLALLEREKILVAPARLDGRQALVPCPGRRVVLGISGAVAAVDAPALVRGLHALGCEVRIALTRSARAFVSVPALDALTHHRVWTGLWPRPAAAITAPVPHINLAEWAELVVVWPASATTLGRIATGDCSDLVAAIATATRAPVLLAPSMNDAMLGAPAVQQHLDTLRAHGRYLAHGAVGHEVAHRPEDRTPMFGPAAAPAAIVELVRHLLTNVAPRPRLPDGAAGWEQLWATTPEDQLPWTREPLAEPLARALEQLATHARVLDLGTGNGTVAIAAARRGLRVTATELSATALGRARVAAGELPILFALDDVTASQLEGPFDAVVDRGVLHCLPPERRPAWAATIARLTEPGSTLLVVAHTGGELATHPLAAPALAALLPGFELTAETPTTLSGASAVLYALRRG